MTQRYALHTKNDNTLVANFYNDCSFSHLKAPHGHEVVMERINLFGIT